MEGKINLHSTTAASVILNLRWYIDDTGYVVVWFISFKEQDLQVLFTCDLAKTSWLIHKSHWSLKKKNQTIPLYSFIKQLSHFTRAQTQRCHFKAEHIKNGSGMSWYKLPQSSALTVIKFDHQEKQKKVTFTFNYSVLHMQLVPQPRATKC